MAPLFNQGYSATMDNGFSSHDLFNTLCSKQTVTIESLPQNRVSDKIKKGRRSKCVSLQRPTYDTEMGKQKRYLS
jgi:hypothetical protein